MVGVCETTIPLAVTTRSTGIKPPTTIKTTTMLAMIQIMPCAERGIGAFTIAVEGH